MIILYFLLIATLRAYNFYSKKTYLYIFILISENKPKKEYKKVIYSFNFFL